MEWNKYRGRWKRWMEPAEKLLFPLILLLFPLLNANQGIDITDTTYSLGYYRFMDRMDLTWVLATYVANRTGSFLMKLPLGDTLLGMNLYTGLIPGILAVVCYFSLKRKLPAAAVFAGELIALSLCWCPTTILYNYLTYFLFSVGSLLLFEGIRRDKKGYYISAGVCLGLNVMVRFPNLLEAALIAAVWFAGWLDKDRISAVAKRTGWCVLGYLAGLCGVLAVIAARYGAGAFPAMIESLFGMTREASDYTFSGMLFDILSAYRRSLGWMYYMIPCILAGMVLFQLKEGKWERTKRAVYCLGILVLLRFYLGRGMFTLRYYDYECVFQWMMLFLLLTLGLCIAGVGGYLAKDRETRILSAIVLVILVITPFGSNNYTWQNMNNLFVVAPYTVWASLLLFQKTGGAARHFPWQAFVATVLLMVLVQGLGFSSRYVFRDGITGEKRDSLVENSRVLEGMYTTKENAESLSELVDFCGGGQMTDTALFWGDAPGLSYILDIPSAIFTTWPEIPSSAYAALERALFKLEQSPAVILHNETGKEPPSGEKTDLIMDFIASRGYECAFANANYRVYLAAEEKAND